MVSSTVTDDDEGMRQLLAIFVMAAVGVDGGAAAADDGDPAVGDAAATVVVPVISDSGAPVYCTRNLARDVAAPMAEGGYRVTGLRPGRYQIRLALMHEHVDVLVVVPSSGEVIVPPVIARGRCLAVEVEARTTRPRATAGWTLRYGRAYRAAFGVSDGDGGWSARSLRPRK